MVLSTDMSKHKEYIEEFKVKLDKVISQVMIMSHHSEGPLLLVDWTLMSLATASVCWR